MAFINADRTEITAKVVYYGPGLSGKTTCFHDIYRSLPAANKGKLLSLATNIDRTIYFDFLPLKFDNIQGLRLRLQLYTVPGQVRFNATRKMVLHEVDGIVFVADMQRDMAKANQESMKSLFENLKELNLELSAIPHVLQYNKEDLPNLQTLEELDSSMNFYHAPVYVSCALSGKGVVEALKGITKLVVADIRRRKIIEQHLAQVAREAETALASPALPPPAARTRAAGAGDTPEDPKSVARRFIQAGIGAPTARVAVPEPRRPSTETIERNIRAGAFEDVKSVLAPAGPLSEPADGEDLDFAELSDGADSPLQAPRDPLASGAYPGVEKEIVVFSDRASELQSGIHVREGGLPRSSREAAIATEEEIEESLSGLPEDEGDILSVSSRVDDTSRMGALRRRSAGAVGETPALSLSPLLSEPALREAFRVLEASAARADLATFGHRAAAVLDGLLADARVFPDDGTRMSTPAKMNVLGIKYARFLRFRTMADRNAATPEDALFGLHFLADVALAKRELG